MPPPAAAGGAGGPAPTAFICESTAEYNSAGSGSGFPDDGLIK